MRVQGCGRPDGTVESPARFVYVARISTLSKHHEEKKSVRRTDGRLGRHGQRTRWKNHSAHHPVPTASQACLDLMRLLPRKLPPCGSFLRAAPMFPPLDTSRPDTYPPQPLVLPLRRMRPRPARRCRCGNESSLQVFTPDSMSFDPIVQKSISEQVAQRLLTMIRSGLLKPDQQLPPERELAAMLGVGRPA
ncbi:FadR/GntR family transcriptional regulator, partial [Herbaspirillum frisingense]|uniref:FadR/GntR family transcriptional regulator n=1 Tax=Herbaspirillum frisingense TaxID=92645 RepID=UPI0039B09614